eukprot:Nitzschia sp. Nitz4//scaffold58_size112336//12487//14775//NITZ4_004016-RA/size112336-processed-gene-0.59-mRNA-1//1//CDS//3329554938//4579//frame0
MTALLGRIMSQSDFGYFHDEDDCREILIPAQNDCENDTNSLRRMASFLSMSDAFSLVSALGFDNHAQDSWESADRRGSSTLRSSPPGLVALHDPPTEGSLMLEDPNYFEDLDLDTNASHADPRTSQVAQAQEQLATAVFAHPEALREYCVDAYMAGKEVASDSAAKKSPKVFRRQLSPETLVEPSVHEDQDDEESQERIFMLGSILERLLKNVFLPVNVVVDVFDGATDVSLDTSLAVVRIAGMTFHGVTSGALHLVGSAWNGVIHFNPLTLVQVVVSQPFNVANPTVVVTGIQSVATGVGSAASSMALYRLSAKPMSSSSLAQQTGLRGRKANAPKLNQKLLRKLNSMQLAASVVAYSEVADDTGGLSRQAKSRVQRMMHYDVSLRPFVATVKVPATVDDAASERKEEQKKREEGFAPKNFVNNILNDNIPSSPASSPGSPFMCTPQSFPPTPVSRRMVLARGARFSDDVVFLARDQLRVHGALGSENERTREMAKALTHGRRLAVFDADDASEGVDLSCGQHVATKVGNMLYCSTRSMVPILRNCFVYFEMTELPKPTPSLIKGTMATMSIGVSTKEMPPNTLVGAWKGSVGLCTTGQMLTAGQWVSPVDHTLTQNSDQPTTVGCLVCLDDGSAFETWDGVIVTAAVTFNVNGRIVCPPVATAPLGNATSSKGSPGHSPIQGTPGSPSSHVGPPTFTVPLLVPAEEELFPTVTLHSPGTAVMSRFSAGDVVASSRSIIGAPEGVTIYAVDGSVIFDADEP